MILYQGKNVGKAFQDGKKRRFVFQRCSFSFPDIGMYGILGDSGSGKSTLLSLLSGLSKPDEGRIFFAGKSLDNLNEGGVSKFRNQDIGIVFQHYNLLNGFTCYENVILPSLLHGKEQKKKAIGLLEAVGLIRKKDQDVATLSGGEKQRVSICRALINSPKALLCDEPTGALDKANAIHVMEILKKLSASRLILLVSHDKELIGPYLDGALFLPSGKIEEYGNG